MKMNTITLPSFWGRELVQKHITNDQSSLVVVFPGQNFPYELPLLYYAGKAAIQSNHDLLLLEYGYQAARTGFTYELLSVLVEECIQSINKVIDRYQSIIFISKSLGTVVAGQVAQFYGYDRIKHIFLTPIKPSIPNLLRSNGIVIYGTGDNQFGIEEVNKLRGFEELKIIAIENANHALEVQDIEDSIEIIKTITGIYLNFLKKE
jgi:hypothetical protein